MTDPNRNPDGTFKVGNKASKGRVKGSRNRFTKAMMKELEQEDFHPMQKLKQLYATTDDDRIKFSVLKEMLSFGNDKQFIEVGSEDTPEFTEEEIDKKLVELYNKGLMAGLEHHILKSVP